MPLNPSDVQFINKLLDNHLKTQRAMSRARWFQLCCGIFGIIVGIWIFAFSQYLNPHLIDFASTASIRHATPSATQPVTQAQLFEMFETHDQLAEGYAQLAA